MNELGLAFFMGVCFGCGCGMLFTLVWMIKHDRD